MIPGWVQSWGWGLVMLVLTFCGIWSVIWLFEQGLGGTKKWFESRIQQAVIRHEITTEFLREKQKYELSRLEMNQQAEQKRLEMRLASLQHVGEEMGFIPLSETPFEEEVSRQEKVKG